MRLSLIAVLVALTLPAPAQDCVAQRLSCSAGGTAYSKVPMNAMPDGVVAFPQGAILLVASGSCPSGFSEVTVLDGKFLQGTVAAHGDVGTTGGSSSITPSGSISAATFAGTTNQATSSVSAGTPAGTNSTAAFTPAGTIAWPAGVPTFSGSAGTVPAHTITWPASVPTFSGSALAAHAHELPEQLSSSTLTRWISSATFGTGTSRAAVGQVTATANTTSAAVALSQAVSGGTPAGTIAWPASVPTMNTAAFTPAGTIAWPASVPTLSGSAGTVPAETFAGSALAGHTHTITPAGSISAQTFTGQAFDPRPQFVKVIFCSKN